MSEERYDFESTEFDWVVLGTDLTEAIAAAALSSRGKRVLSIEAADGYSGSHRSLTLGDVRRLWAAPAATGGALRVTDVKFYNDDSLEQFIARVGLRAAEIDPLPLFIFTDAYSRDQLVAIGIDDYLHFSTVKEICVCQEEEAHPLPCTKADILRSPLLNDKQRAQMVARIRRLLQAFEVADPPPEVVNSTCEFTKKMYNDGIRMLDLIGYVITAPAKDLFEPFFCPLGHEVVNELIQTCALGALSSNTMKKRTTKEVLTAFNNFIKSAQPPNQSPLLYINYGTGDMSQVYSRLSSLYGGICLVSTALRLDAITPKADGSLLLTYAHGPHVYTFTTANLLVGPEYVESVNALLEAKVEATKTQIIAHYVLASLQQPKDAEFARSRFPVVLWITRGNTVLENSEPYKVVVTASNTRSTASGFISFIVLARQAIGQTTVDYVTKIVEKKFQIALKSELSIAFTIDCMELPDGSASRDNVHFVGSIGEALAVDDYFLQANSILTALHIKEERDSLVLRDEKKWQTNESDDVLKSLENFFFDRKEDV